jgi:drug/metabolite transporter (DMT)-like permease
MMWFAASVLALLSFAGMQLCFKKLAAEGVSTPLLLLVVFALGTVFLAVHAALSRTPFSLNPRLVKVFLAAAVLSYLGNLFMVRALATAPNPGYAMGVISGQAVVVTLGAIVLFGSDFSWQKGLGILLTLAGAMLLGLEMQG